MSHDDGDGCPPGFGDAETLIVYDDDGDEDTTEEDEAEVGGAWQSAPVTRLARWLRSLVFSSTSSSLLESKYLHTSCTHAWKPSWYLLASDVSLEHSPKLDARKRSEFNIADSCLSS